MASEWQAYVAGDIAAPGRNSLVGGPFGSDLTSADYTSTGVPVIRGQNMAGRWVGGDFAFVSEQKAERLAANLAVPGDLVFTQRGTLGQVALVPPTFSRFLVSQSQMKLTANRAIADSLFLYYLFSSPAQRDHMRRSAIQTGVPHTNLSILRSTQLALPDLPEQRAIAGVLGAFDDKIELNRKMSETLEAMARALFKSWFVDFDPVRAKADGRDPGLPNHLAALFPDSFEDSAIGKIPRGWASGSLAGAASLNPESWTKSTMPALIDYVDLANVKWGRIREVTSYNADSAPSRAQRVLRAGDTVVGTVRPGNGSYALVGTDGLTGSTGFAVLRPNRAEAIELTYMAATAPDNIRRLAQLADGGAYPAIAPSAVLSTPIALAQGELVAAFSEQTKALLTRASRAEREIEALASARDELLPKLISGELRLAAGGQTAEGANL